MLGRFLAAQAAVLVVAGGLVAWGNDNRQAAPSDEVLMGIARADYTGKADDAELPVRSVKALGVTEGRYGARVVALEIVGPNPDFPETVRVVLRDGWHVVSYCNAVSQCAWGPAA